MLADTRLKFGTLGISYFGNDIMYGKIRPQVRAAWKDLIDLVEEKADRVVFVVGGSSKKYAKHWKLTSQYDDNLAQVRSWIRQRHAVHDLDRQLRRWPLSPDGMHWASEVQEERSTNAELYSFEVVVALQVGQGEMTVPSKGAEMMLPEASTGSNGGGQRTTAAQAMRANTTAVHGACGEAQTQQFEVQGKVLGKISFAEMLVASIVQKAGWRRDDDSSCKRRKVDDARSEHPQPWGWTSDSRSAGDAREHNGSAWSMRRGACDYYENGSSNSYWPDDGSRYWRDDSWSNRDDRSMKRRRLDHDSSLVSIPLTVGCLVSSSIHPDGFGECLQLTDKDTGRVFRIRLSKRAHAGSSPRLFLHSSARVGPGEDRLGPNLGCLGPLP
eukprot:s2670_g3.t2